MYQFLKEKCLLNIRISESTPKEVKQAQARTIFITVYLLQILRQWILSKNHIGDTEVNINKKDDDPFVASEGKEKKNNQLFNTLLKKPTAAFSKCPEHYLDTDISFLVAESTLLWYL